MDPNEAAKLKHLLMELNRICAEAEKVREQIATITHQRPVWPHDGGYNTGFPEVRETERPTAASTERHT
jgi:hypothetical protein